MFAKRTDPLSSVSPLRSATPSVSTRIPRSVAPLGSVTVITIAVRYADVAGRAARGCAGGGCVGAVCAAANRGMKSKLSNSTIGISGILDRFVRYVTVDTTADETQ